VGERSRPGTGSRFYLAVLLPGCFNVAPLWPHTVQRAERRSMSLDASARRLDDEMMTSRNRSWSFA
jgi:hypothetical protein